MIPANSSSNKENCPPISSNCVIWQGPDLTCINLCKGDKVSDVVYKLATELCKIKDSTDMSIVDFDCLLNTCASTQNPELTVAGIIQLIIDNVCCSVSTLTTTTGTLLQRTSNLYSEPTLVLPSCLQYIDPATGLPVTSLKLSQYAVHLANAFCDLRNTVSDQANEILNLDSRVTILENEPPYTPPLVTSPCSYGVITANVPADMDILLSELNSQFCTLSSVLGSFTDISTAASSQCNLLGAQPALSQIGNMSSLTGWNSVISNMAQSMQNLWITVCDMRAVIYDLKLCCATADCSEFILGYTANADLTRANVTLIFSGSTVIPSGFANCPLLSTVTITDGVGNVYSDTLDLVALSSNPAGVTYNVGGAFLNPALPYTVTVTGCIVKDSNTCSKTVSNLIALPTTTTTTTTSTTSTTTTTTTTTVACTCYNWTVSPDAGDLASAAGNTNTFLDGKIFVDYITCGGTSVTTVPYATSTPDQVLGCSCLIPYAYYYNANNATACQPGTVVLDGLCALP